MKRLVPKTTVSLLHSNEEVQKNINYYYNLFINNFESMLLHSYLTLLKENFPETKINFDKVDKRQLISNKISEIEGGKEELKTDRPPLVRTNSGSHRKECFFK